jgi:hypothetical protein
MCDLIVRVIFCEGCYSIRHRFGMEWLSAWNFWKESYPGVVMCEECHAPAIQN